MTAEDAITRRSLFTEQAEPPQTGDLGNHNPTIFHNSGQQAKLLSPDTSLSKTNSHLQQAAGKQPEQQNFQQHKKTGTLTVDGKTYHVQLVEQVAELADKNVESELVTAADEIVGVPPLQPLPDGNPHQSHPVSDHVKEQEFPGTHTIHLDLATALGMVGGQHPAVGFARWKVQEAYAKLDQAEALWLPSLRAGFSFNRHDGNLQASDASIIDVNRNSFQYGLGAGAVGAGTTQRPGILAEFHLADAIFQPDISEKQAWAKGHSANGVFNRQLFEVALAYLQLLKAEQNLRILEESRDRTVELAKLTKDYSDTGQGLPADADRIETELILMKGRLVEAREQIETASAYLSQALSIDAGQQIQPLDPTVTPVVLASLEMDKISLISTGLANRPELKESQALVVAACKEYKRQKIAPLVPSVLLGLSTGGFGGGLGNTLADIDDRYDFDALMTWEIRNLGFGEKANRKATAAKIQQAKFEKIRIMDQVAREVVEAHTQIVNRSQRMSITEKAIAAAKKSYERNSNRIRDGQGLPIEVLQSLRALEDAQRAYMNAVIDHNEAQFRLQWALGWPVQAVAN